MKESLHYHLFLCETKTVYRTKFVSLNANIRKDGRLRSMSKASDLQVERKSMGTPTKKEEENNKIKVQMNRSEIRKEQKQRKM